MMPILGSLGSEWLLCLAIFHACSWCLFMALQLVSGYFALQYFMPAHDAYFWSPESEWLLCLAIFHACSWCLFLALQRVSGYFALQYFMPAHDACSWLCRMWVATLPCNISCLLMMHVLGSLAGEWLLCLFHACSWCLFLTLRMWVATLPCKISCLLMMLVLDSPECEWLLCLALFHACSWCLFLALQEVSALPYFMPDYDAFTWLSRLWVATLLHHVFMPAHDTCSWLSRKSVTTVPCHVLCLLMMPVLDFPGSQWLLYLAIFYACSSCLFLAL